MRPGSIWSNDTVRQQRWGRAHSPVLTLDRYAAMLLRVNAFAALSKQPRGDFTSDERLGGGGGWGGGGGEGGPAISIRERKRYPSLHLLLLGGWRPRRLSRGKPGAGFETSRGDVLVSRQELPCSLELKHRRIYKQPLGSGGENPAASSRINVNIACYHWLHRPNDECW